MEPKNNKNAQFLRLYTSIQAKLYSFILATIHNRSDADELFQETTVVLWDNFDKYQEGSSFCAWAVGIAKNKVLEYLRKNRRAKKIFDDECYDRLIAHAEATPDDISDRIEALKLCIKKLNASDHKLLTLRYHCNNSIREVSQLTGRSTNSLYKSMTRIVLMLRNCISHRIILDGSQDV